jgi:cell division protein ZapA
VKDNVEGVSVSILGKEFMVACPEPQREALRAAAAYLDKAMREIHSTGKVLGTERTAIMAALNIANELLELRTRGGISPETGQQLRILHSKIDAALGADVPARQ